MKKFLFAFVFLAFAASAAFFVNSKLSEKNDLPVGYKKKQPKATRIKEALEWRYSLLADPETGVYDVNMLYAAVAKADQLKQNAANKKGLLNLNWEVVGPDNQGGRTRALIFDKNVPNKLWAGSVGGGLFVSNNGGNSWERVLGYDGFFPIASIAQAGDGALYVGTGEGLGNPLSGAGSSFNSQSPGNGVYKSTDNGATWRLLPGTEGSNTNGVISGSCSWCGVNDIAVNPVNDNVILAATESGLRISTSAGEDLGAWDLASGLTGQGQAIEITSDGLVAYAAFEGRVFRSEDAANNFKTGWSLMPITGGQRADVAIAPSNENYVYASVTGSNQCLSGLWRSKDGGDTWTLIQSGGAPFVLDPFNQPTEDFGVCSGQGWYDQTIAVNPADENKVYLGGITLYTWGEGVGFKRADEIDTEGGDPFNSRYIHADKHEIIFNPQDPTGNQMLVGSDGGVTYCNNANSGFPDNLNFIQKNKGYVTLQVYGMGAGAAGEVLSGNQDNGSQYINGLLSSKYAAQEISGGDGVYAEISNLDPDVMFSGVYFGDLLRSVNRGLSTAPFLDENIDQGGCGKISCSPNSQNCTSNATPFIYPFYLMETSDARFQDTTAYLRARKDTLLLASGATQYILDTFYTQYSVTTTITVSEDGTTSTREVNDISQNTGFYYKFTSRISETVKFDAPIFSTVFPGETRYIEDPFDAKYFVPSSCGLWMCINPIQKNKEPVFYKISTLSNASAFDASLDGDLLYFSISNRLYRVSGLNLIHQTLDPNGCFNNTCAPGLNVTLVATLPVSGTIQGISVEKKNFLDFVLVTVAGFSNSSKVFRIENASTSNPTIVNLHVTDATLPRMPIYDCIVDYRIPERYILGTELGIWTSNDSGQTWSEDNTGMFGRMPVYRLRQEWMYEDNCMVLYAGTHGGGMFRCTSLLDRNYCDPVPYQWNKIFTDVKNTSENSNISNILLYPNPVASVGFIKFDISTSVNVDLKVIDLTGRVVASEQYGKLSAGSQEVNFNAENLAKGSYYAVLSSNGKTLGSKLFVAK